MGAGRRGPLSHGVEASRCGGRSLGGFSSVEERLAFLMK